MKKPVLRKSTPVLPVPSIEASLPFWEAVGFTRTVEVPHGEALGFVILAGHGIELMLQSHASVSEDVPALADDARQGRAFLFVEVAELEPVEQALSAYPVVLPRRQTFYGATEVGYREPGGHVVTFARFGEQEG